MEVPMPMPAASPGAGTDKRPWTTLDAMLAHWPTGRRILASAALCLCVAVLVATIARGMSEDFLLRMVQTVAIAVAAVGLLGMVMSAITGRLSDYSEPADEDEFEE